MSIRSHCTHSSVVTISKVVEVVVKNVWKTVVIMVIMINVLTQCKPIIV